MNFGAVLERVSGKRWWCSVAITMLATSAWASSNTVYYRYYNHQGVRVVDQSIPPEYAQKGYEIVSIAGDVIKVVPPAPDEEDLARKEAQEQLREEYKRLNRRYSSMAEIQSAKQRKLENIETNIAIVRSNIEGLEAQIEKLMAQAADVERAGRAVPEALLKKLENTRAERVAAKDLLEVRLKEYDDAAARFDEDIDVYARGRELTGR